MRALKYLSTLQKRVSEVEQLMEHGFMHVEAWVIHRVAKNTIVDSRATHNFMKETEVKCLNILEYWDTRRKKVVNYAVILVLGAAKRSPIKIRAWMEQNDFVIVKIDNFDIVLGMNFPTWPQSHFHAPSEMFNSKVVQLDNHLGYHQSRKRVKMMSAL